MSWPRRKLVAIFIAAGGLCPEVTVVERLINRLKQFRRIATRYEKLAVNFLAMVTLAALLIWL